MDIETLGMTKDELLAAIIDRAASKLMEEDTGNFADTLERRINQKIEEQITAAVESITERIGTDVVTPRVEAMIEGLTFQKSNGWGEPKEPAKTWREMLVDRAEKWLIEPVNFNGKTKSEDAYSWSASTTRIAFLIDKHLHYQISETMKKVLGESQSKVSQAIVEAVRMSLNGLLTTFDLKTNVKAR